MKIYAGIGARQTPFEQLDLMAHIASELGSSWLLRSGGAVGADATFERNAGAKEIHLPWNSYNKHWDGRDGAIVPAFTQRIQDIAKTHHPVWEQLSVGAKQMMCRNVTIVLGEHLDKYVDMVVCWTKNGKLVGGTSQAMRIAYAYDIPVFNLAIEMDITRLVKHINGRK